MIDINNIKSLMDLSLKVKDIDEYNQLLKNLNINFNKNDNPINQLDGVSEIDIKNYLSGDDCIKSDDTNSILDLSEGFDVCEETPKQFDVVINPNEISQFNDDVLDDTDDSSIQNADILIDELFDKLKENDINKYLIKFNLDGDYEIEYINKKDFYKRGDVILKTKNGDIISSPINANVLNLIIDGKNSLKKNDDIVLLEELSGDSFILDLKNKIKTQKEYVNRLIELKNVIKDYEMEYYYYAIIKEIYRFRYEGYKVYFSDFTELLKQINQKNELLKSLKDDLSNVEDDIIKSFNGASQIQSNTAEGIKVKNLIDRRNELINEIKNTINGLNELLAQLDNIKNSQPEFFATSDDFVLPKIEYKQSTDDSNQIDNSGVSYNTSNVIKNPIGVNDKTKVEIYIPPQDTIEIKDPYFYIRDLMNSVIYFSNQISYKGFLYSEINNDNVKDFDLSFKILKSESVGVNDYRVFNFYNQSKFDVLIGKFIERKKEFLDFILNIDKTSGDLSDVISSKEKQIEINLLNDLEFALSLISDPSKKLGYVALNIDKNLIKLDGFTNDFLNLFELEFNQINDVYNQKKDLYFNTKNEIEDLNNKIKNINNDIKNNKINYSIGLFDNKKVKIVYLPGLNNSINLVDIKEDVNFRGNPDLSTPGIDSDDYWNEFFSLVTVVNLIPIYYPIGLVIPTPSGIVKVPFPILWKYLTNIVTPAGVIVIGIVNCGVFIGPYVMFINMSGFDIGNIKNKSAWFIGAIRPMKKIKSNIGSRVADKTVFKIKDLNIDTNTDISKSSQFIQDDLPDYKRLSLSNIPFTSFLNDVCKAGKKSQGFFEN